MDDAFKHITVLLHEAVDALNLTPHSIVVDCTFGRGGHSRQILQRLSEAGRLIALDRDPDAMHAATAGPGAIKDARFESVHAGFSTLTQVLDRRGIDAVDAVLMDLGVSSPQVDEARRGFSFKRDGPLDMRMDTTRGITAMEWLGSATEGQIREVLKNHGEERHAVSIAQALVARRALEPLRTTGELAALVADVLRACRQRPEPGQDPATRTFQALRIHVNQELEELQAGLAIAMDRLSPGGRLAVISFHSLEDRMVKQAMRARAQPPQPHKRLPLRADQLPQAGYRLIGKAIRPSEAEVAANPRSRSATLRVIERNAVSAAPGAARQAKYRSLGARV